MLSINLSTPCTHFMNCRWLRAVNDLCCTSNCHIVWAGISHAWLGKRTLLYLKSICHWRHLLVILCSDKVLVRKLHFVVSMYQQGSLFVCSRNSQRCSTLVILRMKSNFVRPSIEAISSRFHIVAIAKGVSR